MALLTKEQFEDKANKKFNNLYDYSETKYNGIRNIITFKCKKCGDIITQYASDHLKGRRKKCKCDEIEKNKSKEKEFKNLKFGYNYNLIKILCKNKAVVNCKVHGIFIYKNEDCPNCKKQEEAINNIENKYNYCYDYSEADFSNSKIKTKIKCKKHNIYFISSREELMKHINICPECLKELKIIKLKNNFIKKFNLLYKDSFEIVSEYNGSTNFINIKCKKCGFTEKILPISLLSKKKKKCGNCELCKRITKEIFLQRSKEIHGNKYEYYFDYDFLNSHSFINIKCKKHNYIFKQQIYSHLYGHGCPLCNESQGERKIRIWFENNNIEYIPYYYFSDLKDKNYLTYDFYLKDYNLLIEFNGLQHYKFCNDFHETLHDFHRQLHHDWLKRKYARKNGIKLITIKYNENVEEVLKEELKEWL